jgi:hypothetical protein
MLRCCRGRWRERARELWTPAYARLNLRAWHDPFQQASRIMSGSVVTGLNDLSGNGINLSHTNSPTYNASDWSITFNGSNQKLESTATFGFTTNGDFTVFLLINPNSSQASVNTPLDVDHSGGGSTGPLVVQNETARPAANSYYFAYYTGSGFSNTGSPFVVTTASRWSLMSMRKSGSSCDSRVNGARGSGWPSTQSSSLTGNARALTIGACKSTAGRNWGGRYAGSIIFSRALSDREMALVEGYILWQRNWNWLLAADHPFKLRPPLAGD